MGGRLGEMVDRYRRMTMKEYNDVVEMCQMHGVPVSKAVLGKGKAVQACSFLKNMVGFNDQAAVHWFDILVNSTSCIPAPGAYTPGICYCSPSAGTEKSESIFLPGTLHHRPQIGRL